MPLTPAESNDNVRSEQDVRNYYDDNTNLFRKLGVGGVTGAIHQPLFLKGDETPQQAAHAQHKILHQIIESTKPKHVVDLGCGVGGALSYLAQKTHADTHFTGVTISPKQASLGTDWLQRQSLTNARIICGSYLDLPESLLDTSLAFAIESFIHATDTSAFFRSVSEKLNDEGMLIIFDDFLSAHNGTNSEAIENFEDGWRANALHTISDVSGIALESDLILTEARDLTKHQKLWRSRDRFVAALQPILPLLPVSREYRRFLRGGNARQQLYRQKMLVYAMLVFRKSSVK